MELDLFQNIAQIAPGFIGVAISKLMNGDPKKENLNDSFLGFFLYAGAAWLVATAAALVAKQIQHPINQTGFIILSMLAAALIGILWPTILRSNVISIANSFLSALGKNKIFMDEEIMDQIGHDNKPHYYEVYRNGQLIASGWGEHISSADKGMSLIKIDGFKVEDMKEIRNIVWQQSDMVVKEYTMPE